MSSSNQLSQEVSTMDSAAEFEDEMLALNPEYDLIFSKYNEVCTRGSPTSYDYRKRYSPNKMKIITKMNEIIGQKPIGELPTQSDWDEHNSVEKETIALMRKFGLEQSVDRPPDVKRTISTIPTTDDVIIMRNGHKKMSIFMSDSFFELKPRAEPTFCLDDEPRLHDESTSASEVTAETSLSSKISSDSGTSASTSAGGSEIAPQSKVDYTYVSSNSSDTSKSQSDLSWRRSSPESSGSSNALPKYSSKVWGNKCRRPFTDGNTNWRSGSSKPSEAVKSKGAAKDAEVVKDIKVKPELKHVEKETEVEQKLVPKAISNCGRPLYKPKDLFLKKKAMRIQQVLAANQS